MLGYLISYRSVKPDPDRMKPLHDLPIPHNQQSLKRAMGLFSYYSQWIPRFSDKIQPLINDPVFPLSQSAIMAFNKLKDSIVNACIACPNNTDLLVLESDASDVALSASLNQNGKPVAFFLAPFILMKGDIPQLKKKHVL